MVRPYSAAPTTSARRRPAELEPSWNQADNRAELNLPGRRLTGGRSPPSHAAVGNDESGGHASYGHRDAPPRNDVIIRMHRVWSDYDICVKPGLTHLGPADVFDGAWYTGKLCWAA